MATSVASSLSPVFGRQQSLRPALSNHSIHPSARCAPARVQASQSGLSGREFGDTPTSSRGIAGETGQLRTDAVCRASDSAPCSTTDSLQPSTTLMLAGLLSLVAIVSNCDAALAAGDASASHSHWAPALGDLAENEDFWGNVAAYGRYFVSVMLGTAYIMTKPFAEALKRPKTAVLVVLGTGALFWFLSASVKLMLGIDEGFVWPWVIGFGTTFFLLTKVALGVTDEDVKNSKMTNPRGNHN